MASLFSLVFRRVIHMLLLSLPLLFLSCEAIDRPGASHALSGAEIAERARKERDRLLDRLVENAILYERRDRIELGVMDGYPTRTINESWTFMEDEGVAGARILLSRDPDGRLLLNSIQTVEPAYYVFADTITSFYAGTGEDYSFWPMENMWFMPMQMEKDNFDVVGSGYLHGRPSTVFARVEPGYRMEIELVNDSPILHRMSIYDETGLTSQITLLEYHVIEAPELN